MIRCETCLCALQVADREDNDCPSCKDYKGFKNPHTKKGINVCSAFDGISGAQVALDYLGIPVDNYYASEIDKYPISITQKNYPDTIQLGSVTDWESWDIDWSSIDLVVGGFPCQAWSNAGLKQGDKDPRGMLFWTMLDVMKKVLANNPQAKFLMENVRMKKSFEDYITFHTEEALGKVNKHLINSALVSAQNRKRFYWTNIEGIDQPEDQGLVLADILIDGCVDRDKSYCIDANYHKGGNPKSYFEKRRRQLVFSTDVVELNENQKRKIDKINTTTDKSNCITTAIGRGGSSSEYLTSVKKKTLALEELERPCELRDFDSKAQCHHIANATDIKGNESIKRVYADSGKSPTLTTMGGGHREPKVLCVNPIKEDGTQTYQQDRVYSKDGKMVALTASLGGRFNVEKPKDNVSKVLCGAIRGRYIEGNSGNTEQRLEVREDQKTNTLTTVQKDNVVVSNATYRKLTPTECERLQTFPVGYTEGISNSQRYKCLGNSFTISVISHILSYAFRSNI